MLKIGVAEIIHEKLIVIVEGCKPCYFRCGKIGHVRAECKRPREETEEAGEKKKEKKPPKKHKAAIKRKKKGGSNVKRKNASSLLLKSFRRKEL